MNIKQLRITQNVKQIKLVRELKVSVGCISQWENGKRTPKIEQLPKLAKVLNCSIETLVNALIETKQHKEQRNERN